MDITKTTVLKEVQAGGDVKEVASRLGIPVARLREAAKAFNINLRSKPRKEYNFIDDTEEVTLISNTVKKETKKVEEEEVVNVSTNLFGDDEDDSL